MTAAMITCLPVVLFRHQEQYFALEAQYVSRQGQSDGLDDHTLTHFADLLSHNTQTVVTTAVHWLELCDGSMQPWRLGLQASAELVELSIESIYRLPVLLSARCQFSALQALAWYQNELVALLSVAALHEMLEQPS